jgi:hypothetical protein
VANETANVATPTEQLGTVLVVAALLAIRRGD